MDEKLRLALNFGLLRLRKADSPHSKTGSCFLDHFPLLAFRNKKVCKWFHITDLFKKM